MKRPKATTTSLTPLQVIACLHRMDQVPVRFVTAADWWGGLRDEVRQYRARCVGARQSFVDCEMERLDLHFAREAR